MTSEERILRGREAERMLAEGSVLNQAIEAVEKEMFRRFMKEEDRDKREEARAILLGTGAIVHALQVFVSDGHVEGAKSGT